MPLEAARIAATREWFEKVAIDLRGAEIDLSAKPPLPEDALFHCQQAVEKALKGFLTWHDRPFRKTHDLRELRERCTAIDSSLEGCLAPITGLTDYAWLLRYPGEIVTPTLEEGDSAWALAREVVASILARLPAEVRP